jgi:hypothetical protein
MVGQIKKPGNDLLSHRQAAVREYALGEYAVPSAEQGVNFRVGRAPPEGRVGRQRPPPATQPPSSRRAGRVLRGFRPREYALPHRSRVGLGPLRPEALKCTACGITITMKVLQ